MRVTASGLFQECEGLKVSREGSRDKVGPLREGGAGRRKGRLITVRHSP